MGQLTGWDQALFHFINTNLSNPYFDIFFPAITDLHKTWGFRFVFLPIILALMIYFHRLKGLIIFIGLALSQGLGDKIGSIGKHFWQRPRPFEIPELETIQRSAAGGFSFPSNHALNMFCVAYFLSVFFPRGRWVFFVCAFLVAMSRVYNGVHFPFDVISGGVLGVFVGLLGATITKKIISRLMKEKKVSHG